jgi:D-3-phosphoglycerate dehydrogenase / 2-oxoglutarate reductase
MSLVAVTDHPFPDLAIAREILEGAGHTLVEHHCRTGEEVAAACADADGLLNTYAPIPAATLRALRRCRAIARFGIGVDTIDLDVADELGITVTNVPDYCSGEVAAHTLALLLAVHRRIVQLDRDVHRGGWDVLAAGVIRRLDGSSLGLVGAGRIARAIATRAAAFGLRVLAYDPYLPDEAWPASVEQRTSLETLVADSDFLSLHVPAVAETYHLVDEALLRQMRPHAILINTARGALVDSEALVRALREGWIAGAGLDVVEREPLDPGHELREIDTVVLTPHVAFYSEESLRELQRKAAEELRSALAGVPPAYLVNDPARRIRS